MPYTIPQILEGLDSEVITQVEGIIKTNTAKLDAKLFIDGDGEHFVPAGRLSEVTTERNQLRTTLAENKQKIDALDTLTKDSAEAQTTIAELNTQLDNQSKLTKKAAITAKLASSVTDSIAPVTDLLGFLNEEEITVKEDGSVIGLDEQLSKVRESRKYLFKEVEAGASSTGAQTGAQKGTGDPGTNGLGGPGTGGSASPKTVGTFGKTLAEKATKSQATEDSFWK